MNIPYLTVIQIFCCVLLFSSCGYNDKRVLSPAEMDAVKQTRSPKVSTKIAPEQSNNESSREQQFSGFSEEDSFKPDPEYVKGRVSEYGRKLERWQDLDNQTMVVELDTESSEKMLRCFRELQTILNGYNRIHESLQRQDSIGSPAQISTDEMMQLEQMDVAFLESSCGRVLGGGMDSGKGWYQNGTQGSLVQVEILIEQSSRKGEFEEVIQIWQELPEDQLATLTLTSRMFYGNALMALHQEEAAAAVYLDIIDRMVASDDQRTDILSLRKILADLYTASGSYDKAVEQYRKISYDYRTLGQIERWATMQLTILERSDAGSQELLDYSALLRNSLGFIPQRDGYKLVWQTDKFLADYPLSTVSANVDSIKSVARTRADQWLALFLAEVDTLAEEEQFQEALLLLGTLPDDIVSGEDLITIRKKSDDLTLAAAVNSETRKLEKMRAMEQDWNDALLLVDSGAYDEAIESLTNLLDSDYGLKAENKITEVSLLAARAERRRAADLFIQFTKATDIESRKKLLVESRRCLTDILIKYPDVEITDKVMGNIQRVEKEMNAIDPMLISQSELVGEEEGTANGDSVLQPLEPMGNSSNPQVLQEQNIE